MKTFIFTVALLVASTFFISANAQNNWVLNPSVSTVYNTPSTFSFAIGTQTADLGFQLHVMDNIKGGIIFENNASTGIQAWKVQHQSHEKAFVTYNGDASFHGSMRIGHMNSGGVYQITAGAIDPNFRLLVDGHTFSTRLSSNYLKIGFSAWQYTGSEQVYVDGTSRFTGASQFDGAVSVGGTSQFDGAVSVDGTTQFNGAVAIGTVSYTAFPNYQLFVEGGIAAEKIRVALPGSSYWPDFVFQEDYNFMTIYELKSFIQNNKHLPHVQSAEEVEKNGIDVLEANKALLQTVEELTLYIIELREEIDLIKSRQ